MTRIFGTDGVRGLANELLTADMALDLAQAAAIVLGHNHAAEGQRPRAVLARDGRASGEFLGAAVAAGLAGSGVDVHDAGVVPTPALAYLVGDMDADFGVMISASHNPAPDNGIKFLAHGGKKLPDAVEDKIQALYESRDFRRPTGAGVGRISTLTDAEDRYVLHLVGAIPHRLEGIKVVLDCAHGAAAGVSPDAFHDAGAELVKIIGSEPDGLNINDGVGSTHLGPLKAAVVEYGADLGIAHDGDADRCLAVDAEGNEIDGDQIMGILALSMHERGRLEKDTLVVTVMSNLGLKLALRERGLEIRETKVGDRYVLEAMTEENYNLGGEQSGHVIMSDWATTGDGLLTGLMLASRVAETGLPLSELGKVMTRLPQILINVKGVDRSATATDTGLAQAVAAAEGRLGETGRVLLRASGTEPVVRVMVEAATEEQAREEAEFLAGVVADRLAL
ncbi:phosphoglucosamine mutase [Kocuria sp. JC486]|uniref:Phosphoglucosamine mutase n=1 Tax=Kocuria soli TaxID=2485125 RepID=A0A3N3ZXV1_9MICC|nr:MULTISPECIES: phosphoglucosamine mutase [Kocuria]NHU84787.1 phosphoglucosamine mutase [Kocuria sp. JC486]ROZ63518.1 phosphoglucosamine mutase [Kocuria soli]